MLLFLNFFFLSPSFLLFYFSQPQIVIVPHHNLVAATRQKFLSSITLRRFSTQKIILLGPDHFSVNQKQISYTTSDWNLQDGQILFDHGFDGIGLNQNDFLLKNDHTIYNLLSDIHQFFPKAKIIPILLGQKLAPGDLESVYQKIKLSCGRNCLLIASVDFSHYLPATLAYVHDTFTLSSLKSQNLDKTFSSEVDSPQSLYLVSRLGLDRGLKFQNLFYTNSGFITKNPDAETTTHIFGLYSPALLSPKPIIHTSLQLPYPIDRKLNQNTLGDRFFYGVDKIDYNSTLPGFVIATAITPKLTTSFFLPITSNDKQVTFIRGQEKINLIKNYFDTINTPGITKNYFWGKLTYETKN